MKFKHKLSSGKVMEVDDDVQILGLCEETMISVSPKLKGKEQLEVFIHELLHAEHDRWSEEEVDKRAVNLAEYLWKVGYRRRAAKIKIEKKKKAKKKLPT